MLSTKLKEAAGNGADATLYVDDVFSTYLYTGNGSTQTITNGIDLAGNGGLIWFKSRSNAVNNSLYDTARGLTSNLNTDSTTGAVNRGELTSFNSNGFTVPNNTLYGMTNFNGYTYASWTFRKAAKFFDVVTYTGTGSARTIAHSLGVAPGMIIVKRTDTTGNWQVYSNGLTSAANSIQLNLTAAQASAPTVWNSTAPTSSVFSVGTDATVNASGGTYVAYLYAHDTAADGIIQCGSVTTNASVPVDVNLGWEPQYVLIKVTDITGNWYIWDIMRGYCVASSDSYLVAQSAASEATGDFGYPTATGFTLTNLGTRTYIYMAIRRPNKPPTSGTQVFSPVKQAGGGTVTTGFPVDLSINTKPTSAFDRYAVDRLRGVSKTTFPYLMTDTTGAEVAGSGYGLGFDNNTGYLDNGVYGSGETPIYWNFKRAPGFFDVVCYTGDGTTNRAVAHNLTSAPNMIIAKARSGVANWFVYVSPTGSSQGGFLNTNADWAAGGWTGNWFANTTPTASNFYISYNGGFGSTLEINNSGTTYVAYLFATLAGISKVGSYTGNGSSQNIECGFAAGARFFLVKATSTTGSWWVWDSARGITAGNDPALQLNSTAAEITTADAVDPYSPGITVNQEATCSINASGVSYIFLAVA